MLFTKTHIDFSDLGEWITPLRQVLDLRKVALSFIRLPEGKGYTYLHAHQEQEEVYFVLQGEGLIYLNGEELPLTQGDLVKVDPPVKRALKAGLQGDMFVLCVGGVTEGYPRNSESQVLIDDGLPLFDELPPWVEGNENVKAYNTRLKGKYQRRQQKKSDQS